jgi:hypothetical protein
MLTVMESDRAPPAAVRLAELPALLTAQLPGDRASADVELSKLDNVVCAGERK